MKETNKKTVARKQQPTIFPSPIQKGDSIGLVAPAGPLVNREKFTSGIKILEEKGFKLKFNSKLLNAGGYLAGSDQERADEFNRLWADPDVKAVIGARGGYGSLRMVDLLDMKLIRKNPKILIGFSDLTVLLNAISIKTGIVTHHGPVVTTLANIDLNSRTSFFNCLAGNMSNLIRSSQIEVLKKGTAEGILRGGNLTTLVHTIGTPYEIPWKNTILFLEDVGESPYRLDRLLTHLDRAGRLRKISGLILGTFSDDRRKASSILRKAVQERILDLLHDCDIPVWTNFPSGHTRVNLTLPIGTHVEMDSHSGELHLYDY